jgi:hypothetical protein
VTGKAGNATKVSNTYNAPVYIVSGDSAQLAWGDGNTQSQNTVNVAPGFEQLAELVAGLLKAPVAGTR